LWYKVLGDTKVHIIEILKNHDLMYILIIQVS